MFPTTEELAAVVNQDQDQELRRLRTLTPGRADQLGRAVENYIRRRQPKHESPLACRDAVTGRMVEAEDWTEQGCRDLCSLCLLNRALAIFRGRA